MRRQSALGVLVLSFKSSINLPPRPDGLQEGEHWDSSVDPLVPLGQPVGKRFGGIDYAGYIVGYESHRHRSGHDWVRYQDEDLISFPERDLNVVLTTQSFVFLSGTAEDFGQDRPEKWNSRVLLCVENLPQLAVQSILLYLQGAQGFSGWDWAIWVQTLVFSLLNIVIRLRKLGKDLRGREIEMMDHGAGVVGAVGPVLAVVTV